MTGAGLPRFADIRRDAFGLLGRVQDVLRSDRRPGTCPTTGQGDALGDAQRNIAAAKDALDRAVRAGR